MINLQNRDCLDLLKSLPNESVDLILVDPPYFQIMKNEWDNQWENEAEYLAWCKEWSHECHRILKPNRCFCVWGTTKTDTFLRYKLEVLNSLDMEYQNWVIWSYDWGGRSKKSFARKHEDLLIYSKGSDFLFNSDSVRIPYKVKTNVRKGATNNSLGKIPTDVWEKNNHTTSAEYCAWHPTQKPLSLLERLIKAYTNEGDLVLDCFSGSGSTAIAAKNCGRKFIGCERDTEYYNKSLLRIKELTQDTLPV
jgi:DNA modification methylase